jgi:hypothetical protein
MKVKFLKMMVFAAFTQMTDQLDKLCTFFECEIHELVRFVPDTQLRNQAIAA